MAHRKILWKGKKRNDQDLLQIKNIMEHIDLLLIFLGATNKEAAPPRALRLPLPPLPLLVATAIFFATFA